MSLCKKCLKSCKEPLGTVLACPTYKSNIESYASKTAYNASKSLKRESMRKK